jgi:hypothetical protein
MLAAIGCSDDTPVSPPTIDRVPEDQAEIVVPSRAEALKDYPCSGCHANATTTPSRFEGAHNHIRLRHIPDSTDCSVCHSSDRDRLQLVGKRTASFDQVYLLCGQCHSAKRADWQQGIHGKQVGSWRATRHRYACTECHDPHAPAIAAMEALPAPPVPRFAIPKRSNHGR